MIHGRDDGIRAHLENVSVLGPDGDISMPFRSLVANHVAASKRFPLLAAKLHAPIADYATSCGEILRPEPISAIVGSMRASKTRIRTAFSAVFSVRAFLRDIGWKMGASEACNERLRLLCAMRRAVIDNREDRARGANHQTVEEMQPSGDANYRSWAAVRLCRQIITLPSDSCRVDS